MPNKRDPSKRLLVAWLDKDELSFFKGLAKQEGLTLTDWVKKTLDQLVPARVKHNDTKGKSTKNKGQRVKKASDRRSS